MWSQLGDCTITVIARGTRYLSALWQAAWDAGDGDHQIGKGRAVTSDEMMKLYKNPDLDPSVPLDHYPSDADADWSKIERVIATTPPISTKKRRPSA
jgi:hypothetical protein